MRGGGRHTVGAGGGAAVGVVTKGVDVKATLGIRVVAGEVPGHGGGIGLGRLLEGDGPVDLGVTSEDSDWKRPRWSALDSELTVTARSRVLDGTRAEK
jgi:hypothetical protein